MQKLPSFTFYLFSFISQTEKLTRENSSKIDPRPLTENRKNEKKTIILNQIGEFFAYFSILRHACI